MLQSVVVVGIGGCVGAVARYALGGFVLHRSVDWRFPLSTFVVNVIGCLVAGLLAGLAEKYDCFGPATRLFLFTGLLGGFTTFSAFGLETVYLLQRHELGMAALNVFLSVLCGVGGLWVASSV